MPDIDKTREQLIEELEQLREQVARLEDSEQKLRSLAESTTAHISLIQEDRCLA
jgi:predicted ribosome quality control (RQC) complex YloA/Tae2 family protein